MTGYQLVVVVCGLVSLAASVWAIWCVAKSGIRYKPAWIIASLVGVIGLGVNWTRPDDIFLVFGVQIPPVMIVQMLATKFVFVKVMFPIGAVLALGKSDLGDAGRQTNR
jgi:hypothetical protein